MKAILAITTSITLVKSVRAEIQGDVVCQSACGLVADAGECRLSVSKGNYCQNLLRNANGKLVYEVGMIEGFTPVSVADATSMVQAEDNNCFAMYYEKAELRAFASYCESNNVCRNLFWDQVGENQSRAAMTYQYFSGAAAETGAASPPAVNSVSPVVCDYASAEKRQDVEDITADIDSCTAVCNLSHTEDECKLVQRAGNSCLRLFWSDESRTATDFSVRKASGTQIPVTPAEARDLLLAENNDCNALCKANADCKSGEAFCSANRTCKGLFYMKSSPAKSALTVCFEGKCDSTLTPVTCKLPEDLAKEAAARNGASANAVAAAGKSDASSLLSGVTAIGIAVLISMA